MLFILSACPVPKDYIVMHFRVPPLLVLLFLLSFEYNFYVHGYFLNSSEIARGVNKRHDEGLCTVLQLCNVVLMVVNNHYESST
jgi:hypothetical protein